MPLLRLSAARALRENDCLRFNSCCPFCIFVNSSAACGFVCEPAMERRTGQKYRTKYAYGKRKRKPPIPKQKRPAATEPHERRSAPISSHADVSSEASLPLESATSSESGGLAPSASHDITVQYRPGHSSVFAAASGGAVPVQRDDGEVLPKQKHTVQVHLPSESITGSESVGPAPSTSRDIAVQYRPGHSSVFAAASGGAVPVQRDDGEVLPKQKHTVQVHLPSESITGSESVGPAPSTSRDIAVKYRPGHSSVFAAASGGAVPVQRDDGEVHLPSESMTGSESGDPAPSTSRDIAVQQRPGQSSVFAAASDDAMPAQRDDSELFPKQKRTVQVHLEPRFVTLEAAEEQACSVRATLRAVSSTERKFGFARQTEEESAPDEDEFTLIQASVMNSIIGSLLCPKCSKKRLSLKHETKLGLAVKLVLSCGACGPIASHWSSKRKSEGRTFEVNIRAMQAIKTIGKGPTALNDFWATMNVSHHGLHQKTYQGHLKKLFKPGAEEAAQNIFADAVLAVKDVYSKMQPSSPSNITVVYDGTWLTRGHSSHIGVGCIIEFYTGLVLDCTVLSNFCLGCCQQPAESDPSYGTWIEQHQCQKNTDVASGQMEVEAALILFRRSFSSYGLRYTNVICDGDSRTYLALCKDEVYGFIPLTKEDCINHVQKRMGTALRTLVARAKKGEPLGGKGGLTQDLIKKLTNYYGLTLRRNTEVSDMQRAVMATLYHVTSTDDEPHHELCPPGPDSWCRHRSAQAKMEPPPPHKYKLPRRVAEALLPVYQRLSDPQLLERCKGNKTQNAAESLHSVIWSMISKDQRASLFAVETAVHEAVARYNFGNLRAYTEVCKSVGIKPGSLALERAQEKDKQRKRKACSAEKTKEQRHKKTPASKDTKYYSPGAF
ncbi:uncharacterized protein LOC144124468 [Amblyomma americanum]